MRVEPRMRVLFIGPVPPPIGGMTIYTEGYLSSPVPARCDVRLLRPNLIGKYRFTGWRRRILNGVNGVWLAGAMVIAVIRHRASIVHILTSSYGGFFEKALLTMIARALGCRVILHVHGGAFGTFYQRSSRPSKWLIRRLLACSHRVLALSEELRRTLLETGLAPDKVSVLENAVTLPELGASEREQAVAADRSTVLFLSRVDREKGVFELIEAAGWLAGRFSGVRFRIVGPESQDSVALRERINTAGLDGRIELPGTVTGGAKDAAFRDAQVYVLPSHLEAMPMGLLEAMSYGLACIATPVGSIPEIITDGRNGLLVPVGDVSALAAAIERLLQDDEMCRRMGAAARKTIVERFDWRLRADQVIGIYQALLAR